MKIYLPQYILEKSCDIISIYIETSNEKKFLKIENFISIDYTDTNYVNVCDRWLRSYKFFRYKINYKNTVEYLFFNTKYNLSKGIYCSIDKLHDKPKIISYYGSAYKFILKHTNTTYSKENVLTILAEKHTEASNINILNNNQKFLIYYTISGDIDWINILELSLLTLFKYKDIDVDILLITTDKFKEKINLLEISSKLNLNYFIVDDTECGIKSSINKLKIYDYNNILDYKKVLFVDCDIIFTSNISNLFKVDLNDNKLYTAWSSTFVIKKMYKCHTLPFHSIGVFSDVDIENLQNNNQIPFNAGQFMFQVSKQMIQHFKNVYWFYKSWPGEYFFEQSFLSHYFCFFNMTDPFIFDKYVYLYTLNEKENLSDILNKKKNTNLIHFIGDSLNSKTKYSVISNFIKRNAIL